MLSAKVESVREGANTMTSLPGLLLYGLGFFILGYEYKASIGRDYRLNSLIYVLGMAVEICGLRLIFKV